MSNLVTNLDRGWLFGATNFTEMEKAGDMHRNSSMTGDSGKASLGSNLVFGFQPNYKLPRAGLNQNAASCIGAEPRPHSMTNLARLKCGLDLELAIRV